ncbi:DinB family protein [bacterium]|nr:DinB family protein [bacterium]
MSISQALLGEFDHEMASTRRALERVPDARMGWKPHEKSYTMQDLASHIANIPGWTAMTLNEDSFDVAPKDGEPMQTPKANLAAELVSMFDQNVKEAREALVACSDDQFMKPWSLLAGGEAMFTMPRVAVMRGFIMNHLIHHRAQLTVYLRMNDIPVPAIYGPSADEQNM